MKFTKTQRIVVRVAIILIGGYFLSGCANNLFYHPDSKEWHSATTYLRNKQDVWFESADGTKLHGWFIPNRSKELLGTVIHYHGNAQNLSSHISFTSWLTAKGYNVFIFDYRGYGKSAGTVDKEGIHDDSVAALKYILSRPDVTADTLVVVGQSLGGNNALDAIASVKPAALKAVVIDSTFYSYREIARDVCSNTAVLHYLRYPLSWWLVTDDYSAKDTIDSISPAPLLIFHDRQDRIVPYHHAEKLYQVAPEPKLLIPVDYGQHTSALTYQEQRITLLNWLAKIESK